MTDNYYSTLGVPKNASQDEIKKAYRKMAMKYHPDRNSGDKDAEQKFKEAAEAYEVLGNPERRKRYDQFGKEGVKGAGFNSYEDIFSSFGDIFGSGGGGIFGDFFGGQSHSHSQRGASLKCEVQLSFEESIHGTEKNIELRRQEICDTCHGSGAAPGSKPDVCNYCGGSGAVQTAQGFFRIQTTCPQCRGTGRIIKSPCKTCSGSGRAAKKSKIKVKIPPGIEDGTRMRISGEGEPGDDGGYRGDLYCYIYVKPHPFFERAGDDILCTVPITFAQASLGTELTVPTMGGKSKMQIPHGTQSGQVFRLRGQGAPNVHGYGKGDLLVKVIIETPRKLTKRQEELLREFSEIDQKHVSPERKSFFDKLKNYFTEDK